MSEALSSSTIEMSQRIVHDLVLHQLQEEDPEFNLRHKRFLEALEAKQEIFDQQEIAEETNEGQEANMEFYGDGEATQIQQAKLEEDEVSFLDFFPLMTYCLITDGYID